VCGVHVAVKYDRDGKDEKINIYAQIDFYENGSFGYTSREDI
jgi:hypothetical protein